MQRWQFRMGLSREDCGYFRAPVHDTLRFYHSDTDGGIQIGECELAAATMAIIHWPRGGLRNVILRTDNRNVFI